MPQEDGRRERAALAFAEVDVEVGVGQLGQVVEGGGQAPGRRIGVDPARDFDQQAALGRLRDQVEGEQGAEAVLVRGREEHRAFDRAFDDRAFDDELADFGDIGAAGSGGEEIVSAAYWASEQVPRPAATDGLTVIPSGRESTAFLIWEEARVGGLISGALLPSRVKS